MQFDCMLFVEQLLALAWSESFDQFSARTQRLRYRDGEVSYCNRWHYFHDWVGSAVRQGMLRQILRWKVRFHARCPEFHVVQSLSIPSCNRMFCSIASALWKTRVVFSSASFLWKPLNPCSSVFNPGICSRSQPVSRASMSVTPACWSGRNHDGCHSCRPRPRGDAFSRPGQLPAFGSRCHRCGDCQTCGIANRYPAFRRWLRRDARLAASGRKPPQRHLALPWPIQLHQQHILILAQLQLSIAHIHGHLVAQQQARRCAWALRGSSSGTPGGDAGRHASSHRPERPTGTATVSDPSAAVPPSR